MSNKTKIRVGRFSAIILAAVSQLVKENATGVNIWDKVEQLEGRRVSSGSLYRTLKDLTKKGYLVLEVTQVEGKTGGYYKLSNIGKEQLEIYTNHVLTLASQLKPEVAA